MKILIQLDINGFQHSFIKVDRGASREHLENLAMLDAKIIEQLDNREVIKCVVVPDKLVNIITMEGRNKRPRTTTQYTQPKVIREEITLEQAQKKIVDARVFYDPDEIVAYEKGQQGTLYSVFKLPIPTQFMLSKSQKDALRRTTLTNVWESDTRDAAILKYMRDNMPSVIKFEN